MKNYKNLQICVVDDDVALNNLVCSFLEDKGFKNVKGFYKGEDLIDSLSTDKSAIIIQDYDMPDQNGIDVLKKVKPAFPKCEFVFLSGQSQIEVAVDAIKLGAFDYIVKDKFSAENVYTKIRNIIKLYKLNEEKRTLKSGLILFVSLFVIALAILAIFFINK